MDKATGRIYPRGIRIMKRAVAPLSLLLPVLSANAGAAPAAADARADPAAEKGGRRLKPANEGFLEARRNRIWEPETN